MEAKATRSRRPQLFRHRTLAVPASLHASLMARLDRLGSAKEVAQIGAAIGREFSHPLLAAVSRKPRNGNCQSTLSTVSLPLVCCSGRECRRKQLICSSTRWYRTQPTARCCASLDVRFTRGSPKPSKANSREIAENQPELLHGTARKRRSLRKRGLWGKAGQRSLARSALVEAIAQLSRALDQIAALRPTPALRREQMKLQVTLITPLMHVRGTLRLKQKRLRRGRVCSLNKPKGSESHLKTHCCCSRSLYSFWVANFMAFRGDAMRELSAQVFAFAEKQDARPAR